MAKKKRLTLDQFTKKVGQEAPKFTRALREEEAYLKFCKKVREDLKQLREHTRHRQADIAAELQMSQPGVSNIENGEGDIGLLTICRYAGALGMQPNISFSPSPSTYLEHDSLKTIVKAMARLSESRAVRLHEFMHDTSSPSFPSPASPELLEVLMSAMSGAAATEMANMVFALSGHPQPDENEHTDKVPGKQSHAATA